MSVLLHSHNPGCGPGTIIEAWCPGEVSVCVITTLSVVALTSHLPFLSQALASATLPQPNISCPLTGIHSRSSVQSAGLAYRESISARVCSHIWPSPSTPEHPRAPPSRSPATRAGLMDPVNALLSSAPFVAAHLNRF